METKWVPHKRQSVKKQNKVEVETVQQLRELICCMWKKNCASGNSQFLFALSFLSYPSFLFREGA